jgi:hypothetical protein
MPRLTEVYVAVLTRNVEDAGTDNPPVLLFSRGGQDLFQIPLGDFDFVRGRAGLHRLNVENRALDSELLELRLLASGDDAWAPQSVIAWGISGHLPREVVVPLGAVLDLANPFSAPSDGTWLSTDSSEGVSTLALRPVGSGAIDSRAHRIIVIAATEQYPGFFPGGGPGPAVDLEDTGTEGPVTLSAGVPGRLMLSYLLPRTPQGDLGQSRANFYTTKLPAPFSRADLSGGWFTLTIGTDDVWVPDYFAVFGLNTSDGQTDMLIPFVHAPQISLEHMSTDPSEGWESNELPNALVYSGPVVHPPVVGDAFGGMMETMARRVIRNPPSPGAAAGAPAKNPTRANRVKRPGKTTRGR